MTTQSKASREVKPPRKRVSRFRVMAWLSGAERERRNLPTDSPRRRPSLPQLRSLDRPDCEDERE